MRKLFLLAALIGLNTTLWAEEPTMTISTAGGDEVLNVSEIRKITYLGDDMVVLRKDATSQSFAMADISSITLQNMPEPQDTETVSVETTSNKARKVLINGVMYIEKDGQRFSILGNRL